MDLRHDDGTGFLQFVLKKMKSNPLVSVHVLGLDRNVSEALLVRCERFTFPKEPSSEVKLTSRNPTAASA